MRSLLFALCAATPLAAQHGLSGSESYTMTARATASAAGSAQGTNLQGTFGLGLTPSSQPTSSANYELRVGVLGFDGDLAKGPPLLFAIDPPQGAAAGGTPLSLVGANLVDGQLQSSVDVGGTTLAPLTASPTQLTLATPPGVNAWGNPLAQVDVGVSHGLGSTLAAEAFLYTPALLQNGAAQIGQTLSFDWRGEAGEFYLVYFGVGAGFGVPLPPLAGSLELLTDLVQFVPLAPSATGVETHSFPVPDNGALAGVTLEFQGVALSSLVPLVGGFTNKLGITLQL